MENSQWYFGGSLEVRESQDRRGPGTVFGLLAPFDKPANDRPEVIEKGALRWTGTIPFNRQHARLDPISRATLEEKGDGVYLSSEIPDTQRGRDLIVEIRSGLFLGLSMEMHVAADSVKNGIRYISDAVVAGAAAVTDSAFETTLEARKQEQKPVEKPLPSGDWWY